MNKEKIIKGFLKFAETCHSKNRETLNSASEFDPMVAVHLKKKKETKNDEKISEDNNPSIEESNEIPTNENNATNTHKQTKKQPKFSFLSSLIIIIVIIWIIIKITNIFPSHRSEEPTTKKESLQKEQQIDFLSLIPEYDGYPSIVINGNKPFFTEEEKKNINTFENYSELDEYGRCQVAFANLSYELIPVEERGEIGHIKPTGWHQGKYEGLIDSNPPYLYNRCHLIAFCLAGENDNERNLITGTRYLNTEGMLPLEEMIANFIRQNKDIHVLYRVTPIFEEENLLANGVLMEGYSVEDNGTGICFCIYCYNIL